MNTQLNSKRGFTLIEVILVLAIAALIFLMVFIALPALQASQRDTARKNDASIVSSAVTQFTSAERRAIATTDSAALRTYIKALDQYAISGVQVVASGDPTATQINVYPAQKCAGTGLTGGTARQAAVRIMMDNGTTFYCVDAS